MVQIDYTSFCFCKNSCSLFLGSLHKANGNQWSFPIKLVVSTWAVLTNTVCATQFHYPLALVLWAWGLPYICIPWFLCLFSGPLDIIWSELTKDERKAWCPIFSFGNSAHFSRQHKGKWGCRSSTAFRTTHQGHRTGQASD